MQIQLLDSRREVDDTAPLGWVIIAIMCGVSSYRIDFTLFSFGVKYTCKFALEYYDMPDVCRGIIDTLLCIVLHYCSLFCARGCLFLFLYINSVCVLSFFFVLEIVFPFWSSLNIG